MPKGSSDIADLRLVVLKKTIESFMTPPNLYYMNRFPSDQNESDSIEWETVTGTRGLTPFVAPGAPAPETAPIGHGAGRAMSAYWKEKLFYDENFLNNLRQVGTRQVYMPAAKRLARDEKMIKNRCERRKEWMFAQMMTEGSFTYVGRGEIQLSVDYGVPTAQKVTLAADRDWDTGSNRNILEDIMDAKLALKNSVGATVSHAVCTTEVLNYMIMDPGIQTLLSKSAFGAGDLFARPVQVLGNLLDIPNFVIYDEQYQVKAYLTAVVTGSSTVNIYVDETTDFVVGGTLRFHDTSANTYEDETISSVTHESGYVTVSTAPTASFKAGEDYVTMTRKFISEEKFAMYCERVEGELIAGYLEAPFGLARNYGMKVSRWDINDPEGTYVMVENKGLPVLFRPEGLYVMDVT